VIAAAVILALFALQSFSAGRASVALQREAKVQGIVALGAVFTDTRLAGTPHIDSKRVARMVHAMRGRVAYEKVTFVAAGGRVVASTDRNLEGGTIAALATPPARNLDWRMRGEVLTVDVPISYGGGPVGTLRVETKLGG
jgi:hypothetical protein